MFQQTGLIIDNIISSFWGLMDFVDINYKLLPEALIAIGLVFFVEWLRKPRIEVTINNEPKLFNVYNSDKWYFEIRYKKAVLNKLLHRYSLTNLKVFAGLYNFHFNKIVDFQCKPDTNPNVSGEKDISAALAPIVLTKESQENFPFLLKPKMRQLNFCNTKCPWLIFDVWTVFLPHYRGTQIYEWCLNDGIYYFRINVKGDQIVKEYWFSISLRRERLTYRKLSILERFKLLLR